MKFARNGSVLALLVSAGMGWAQTYPPAHAQAPTRIYSTTAEHGCPAAGQTSESASSTAEQTTDDSPPARLARSERGYSGGSLTSAGTGLTSATATNGNTLFSTSPLVLPGLFTAANAQSAIPADRVSFNIGYFDNVRTFRSIPRQGTDAAGNVTQSFLQPRADFDLWTFTVGLEKTFLDGRASAYLSVPYLDATDNRANLPIDGLGDVSAGFKAALLEDCDSGSTLSAGFTVSAPTARDQIFVINSLTFANGTFAPRFTTRVNPTFLQPYVSGILIRDRFFVQDYVGVIIPSDDRVATILNNELTAGFQLYRDDADCARLRSATVTVGAQCLIGLEDSGGPTVPAPVPAGAPLPAAVTRVDSFGFSDQLYLSSGLHLGIGKRTTFSIGVSMPVVGPRAYSYGVTTGVGFSF